MRNKRTIPLVALSLAAVLLAGLLGFYLNRSTETAAGQPFGTPFELIAMDGQPITEKAFQGHPSAVFFGFTHCPEVCPTTLFELDGWLTQLGPEGEKIRAYLVTVDPERDTVDVIRDYITAISSRITGITGTPDKVEAMLKGYSVFYRKVPVEGGDYTMDHTASIYLLDSKGDFHGTIAYGENPETALSKLKRLAEL
ncbi:MAG: SCO family protein [Phyllobacterium sp.]